MMPNHFKFNYTRNWKKSIGTFNHAEKIRHASYQNIDNNHYEKPFSVSQICSGEDCSILAKIPNSILIFYTGLIFGLV